MTCPKRPLPPTVAWIPLCWVPLLASALMAQPASVESEPPHRQSITVACDGETVFFTVTIRGGTAQTVRAADSTHGGVEVGGLAIRDRAGTLPFVGMKPGDAAGTVVFTWGDTAAGGDLVSITIPWDDESKGTLRTDADRITCTRGAPAQDFPPFDEPPVAIKLFPPEYPEAAKQAKVEGVVYVRMTIAENGRVIAASVHRSDTIASLDGAAVEAAKMSLFRPATRGGAPVKARVVLPFRFKL